MPVPSLFLLLRLALLPLLLPSSFLWTVAAGAVDDGDSFYGLLGVAQDADLLSIRKAFKRVALLKHPDKNPDDPEAHANFVRINRAYEVLKDEEMRRKYDQFGEKGLEEGGGQQQQQQYQSWQFYRDNFGIYDDNPEIVTLSRADFHEEVFQSGEIWFVNFYSTFCSHCHQLAPVWRELAQQVPEGVARIGAVNCAEDPALCQGQHVRAYPSLLLYPEQEHFQGTREVSSLLQFLLARLPAPVLRPPHHNLEQFSSSSPGPLLFELCPSEDCLSGEDRKMIAAIGSQLGIAFAVFDCPSPGEGRGICGEVGRGEGLFWLGRVSQGRAEEAKELIFADLADLRAQLLAELPALEELDAADLDLLLQRPEGEEEEESVLALLFPDQALAQEPQWRQLGLLFPGTAVRLVPCDRVAQQCAQMHAGQLPRAALFRAGQAGFDMDYGNAPVDVRRVARFVRRSGPASTLVLDGHKLWEARHSGQLWLVDFFAPWCPPCLRLLTELRKMPSKIVLPQGGGQRQLHIGTVDCQAHAHICREEGVNSYPRTVLFTGDGEAEQHQLVGFHTADDLLEFVAEALAPSVESLDADSFQRRVLDRAPGQLFFVDFFAPWCGPCQQLAPEFRRLARQWAENNPGKGGPAQMAFGAVDCQAQAELCRREGVRSYPSLRLYRHAGEGGEALPAAEYPPNWWRNAQTMAHWLAEMAPSRVQKLASDFPQSVLDSPRPFLVDFYAPWCSHCVQFAPTFERLAQLLEGRVRLGKVDCERFGWICQNAGVQAFPSLALYFGTAHTGGRRQDPVGMAVQHGPEAERIAERVEQLLAQKQEWQRDEL